MTLKSPQSFLELFYAAPNLLKWEAYTSGKLNKLSFCITRLRSDRPVPTILPFMEHDKTLTWFALAFDEKSYTQLREQVQSFIGPSYSNFNGFQASGVPHVMNTVVNTFTNGYYFSFRGNDTLISEKLNLMFQLLDRKSGKSTMYPKEPYPILRDFQFALQANEREEAEKQIQLLERHRLLDPRNILFTRIELFAHFEEWKEIINHPQMEDLMKASRPSRVTESMIRAVFHVYLNQHINNVEYLIKEFREKVWPQYQMLYRTRGSLVHPDTIISFMLRAVDPDTPQPELQRSLLAIAKGTEIEPTILSIISSKGDVNNRESIITTLPATLEHAKLLADRGKFDQSLEIALQLPLSKDQIQLMLLCAFELQDHTLDKQVASKVASLGEVEWQSILTNRQIRVCYEHLTPYLQINSGLGISTGTPTDWNEWLERYTELGKATAIELARRDLSKWEETDSFMNTKKLERFINNLKHDTEASREAVPYLIRYLESDPKWPRPDLKEVYLEIHRRILKDMQGGSSEMKLSSAWSETLIRLQLNPYQYRQLFEQLSIGWENHASTKFLEILYPFLQSISEEASRDHISCWRFIHSIRDKLKEHSALTNKKWIEQEERFIPKEWETWYSALFEATEDYHFLSNWIHRLGASYDNWAPTSIQRIQDWMTVWGVEELDTRKRDVLTRSLLPFLNYVTSDPNFPEGEETEFYETLAVVIRTYARRNKDTLEGLFRLLDGLLFKKPEVAEIEWRSTFNWINIQPTQHLLVVITGYIELFNDYGVSGMYLKPLWDEWVGRLCNNLDEETKRQLPFLIDIGELVGGNYLILQKLKDQENKPQDEVQDPLKQLPAMSITIFSLRERAAQRAADRIMLRNPQLQVRVCTQDRATDQTTAFARHSDLSIIVTSCISHALTYGIKEHLSNDPIYPRSSGEAGIVEQLEIYAREFSATKIFD